MRTLSIFMLFWVGLLTAQPVIAEVCMSMQSEDCCAMSCEDESTCSEDEGTCDESTPCEDEDAPSKCCMEGCAPCALCCCFFGATVEHHEMNFSSNAAENTLAFVQNKNTLSGFLSSPFQPPEVNS